MILSFLQLITLIKRDYFKTAGSQIRAYFRSCTGQNCGRMLTHYIEKDTENFSETAFKLLALGNLRTEKRFEPFNNETDGMGLGGRMDELPAELDEIQTLSAQVGTEGGESVFPQTGMIDVRLIKFNSYSKPD